MSTLINKQIQYTINLRAKIFNLIKLGHFLFQTRKYSPPKDGKRTEQKWWPPQTNVQAYLCMSFRGRNIDYEKLFAQAICTGRKTLCRLLTLTFSFVCTGQLLADPCRYTWMLAVALRKTRGEPVVLVREQGIQGNKQQYCYPRMND